MAEGDTTGSAQRRHEDRSLPAGSFSSWVVDMQTAIRGRGGSDVPCDGCTACCTSSQFVHIEPDEIDTLSHIPAELLFPAPRRPRGHMLLGYDERGHCPMLIEDQCSIYEHRPSTCRTYDCRVFPATGIDVDATMVSIGRRTRRWQFDFPAPADRIRHDAVRAAAAFIDDRTEVLPGAGKPNATQRAVLAIDVHDAFLANVEGNDGDGDDLVVIEPDPDVIRTEITRRTRGHPST